MFAKKMKTRKYLEYLLVLILGLAVGFLFGRGVDHAPQETWIPAYQPLSDPGRYEIRRDHTFLEISRPPPEYSVIQQVLTETRDVATNIIPRWEPGEGWFISFEPPEYLWVYQGDNRLHLARVLAGSVDFSTRGRKIPDEVRRALPIEAVERYEREQNITRGNSE